MKCQILFSGKNKKNTINLSSAELAHIMLNVNPSAAKYHRKSISLCQAFFQLFWKYWMHTSDLSYLNL